MSRPSPVAARRQGARLRWSALYLGALSLGAFSLAALSLGILCLGASALQASAGEAALPTPQQGEPAAQGAPSEGSPSQASPPDAPTQRRQGATPPAPTAPRPMTFPPFLDKTLDNGLRVVVVEHHEQPAVSLRLVSRAGRLFEPHGQAGVASLVANLLTQGTEGRNAQQIAQAVDRVGGRLNASAGADLAFVSAAFTSDQLTVGLELLAEVVLHPSFPEEEVARRRDQTVHALQVQMEDPAYLADAAFDRLIFGSHPYGNPAAGTESSLKALTREQLAAFHRGTYLPGRSLLAIVGDVAPDKALAEARRLFGGWKPGEPLPAPDFPPTLAPSRRVVVIDRPDAVQTQIRVGQVALTHDDPDFFAAQVYNSIVGGGVSARLYEEIRRKRGLSYGAGSGFSERLQPGLFRAFTFTKTESTVETLGLVLGVLDGMEKERVPAEELAARKTFLTGAFPLEVETPDGIANLVLEALAHGHDREYLETYRDRLDSVTSSQVRSFAQRRIHPERATIVLAGNAGGFVEELKKTYGDVEIVPYDRLDLEASDLQATDPEGAPPVVDEDAHAQGLALLRKAQQAMGGEAYTTQRSQILRGSGKLTLPGSSQPLLVDPLVVYRLFPDKLRNEMGLPFGLMVQGFNGDAGWTSSMGQVQDMSDRLAENQRYGVDLLRLAAEEGHRARPLPDEKIDGVEVPVVELTDAGGHATRFYLDPETSRVLKVAFDNRLGGSEVIFDDYREVEGLQIPFHTQLLQNGSLLMEHRLTEAKVNPEVDPALFERPDAPP